MTTLLTVLFVDKDGFFSATYRTTLEEAGYRVLAAESIGKALGMVKRYKIHLLIIDLAHSEGTGRCSVTELRAGLEKKPIPILIFAVLSESNALQKALKSGATDYLVKGRSAPNEVLRKVKQLTVPTRQSRSVERHQKDG